MTRLTYKSMERSLRPTTNEGGGKVNFTTSVDCNQASVWSQPRASGAEILVFTHGYHSVVSYHVHVRVLRLIKRYTGPAPA